eukprot:m.214837 g.214837  ORF g.214837 m.214837 type:complete len:282 (+) comp13799_c0_seq35:1955-2800(+)
MMAARRLLGWFLWALIVAGCFAAVWFVISSEYKNTYLAPAVFSFINGGLPVLIVRIPKIEKYKHPKTVNKITTGRVFLLRILTIFALMYGYYNETELTKSTRYVPNTTTEVTYEIAQYDQTLCAGTQIGQDVYRLILVDTVIGMAQRFLSTVFWYYWLKRRVEMDLVQWSLHLLYRQALVWLGMCFAPVLPVIAMLTNILFFYFYVALVCLLPIHNTCTCVCEIPVLCLKNLFVCTHSLLTNLFVLHLRCTGGTALPQHAMISHQTYLCSLRSSAQPSSSQ